MKNASYPCMTKSSKCFTGLSLLVFLSIFLVPPTLAQNTEWRSDFHAERKNLGLTGKNPYFILSPGLRLHYREGKTTLTRTVLPDTEIVDSVRVYVVEDREKQDSNLVEVARDYYAIDKTTNDVYYFGEKVDSYSKGKVISHAGTWLSGGQGAAFGLQMPFAIKLGDMFYQELAPKVAMDRAEVVGKDEKVVTLAGTFEHCVHFKETSNLEKGAFDQKWYAPGVGMIKDNGLVLVKIEKPKS